MYPNCNEFAMVVLALLSLKRFCVAYDSREWSSESHEDQLNHLLRAPPVRSPDPGPASSIVSFFAATASETLPQPIRRFFAALWALLSNRDDVVTQKAALQTLTLLELVNTQHRSAPSGGRRSVPVQNGSPTKNLSSKKAASGDPVTTPEASEADSTQKSSSSDLETTTSAEPEKDSTGIFTSETTTDETTSSNIETTQDSTSDTTTEESTTTTESTTETSEKTATAGATSDTTEKATTLHEALEHDGFPAVHPEGYSARSLLRHPDYFSFREPIQVPQVDEYHFIEAPSERGFPPLFRSRPYPTSLDYQFTMPQEKQSEYFRSILMEEPSP